MIDQWTVYWLERLTNIYYTAATVLVVSLIVFIVSLAFVVAEADADAEFQRWLCKVLLIAGIGVVLSTPALLFIPTSREYAAMKAATLAGTPEGARAMPVLEVYLKDRRTKNVYRTEDLSHEATAGGGR